MSGVLTRVHVVSPAFVTKTVARYGRRRILTSAEFAKRAVRGFNFKLSIGHADGAAIAGLAETMTGTIGVDVESTKPLASGLLEPVLQPSEIANLRGDGDHGAGIALWTAKEAVWYTVAVAVSS